MGSPSNVATILPEEDIRPTYLASHMPLVGLTPAELELVGSFKKYFAKTWLDIFEIIAFYEMSK